MTALPAPVPLIFEASISAQMILFAGVQAAGVGRFGALRGVLALLTGCLGLAVGLNTLAAMGVLPGLRDLTLFLEIACAAAVYRYVAHAHDGRARLALPVLWHLMAAVCALLVWKAGFVRSLEALMLAILSLYAIATVAAAWRYRRDYRPVELARFVALLTVSFFFVTLLRAAMMYEVELGIAFRDS